MLGAVAGCGANSKEPKVTSTSTPTAAGGVTPAQAREIAKDAYVYGFPIVDGNRIQYAYFADPKNPEYKGAWNQIHNTARVFTPADTAVQTPNSDTPYSFLGADLRAEPLVLTLPAIEAGRYYSIQFVDGYTYNFAYVGSRTTGNGGGKYLLAGPGWHGEKPAGINAVIQADTDWALGIYRTQLFGPDDLDNVKKIQAGYQVEPLSAFLNQPAPAAPPALDFAAPLTPDQEKTDPHFFNILNSVLRYAPVLPSEKDLRARFATIGIGPDGTFNADTLTPEMRTTIEGGMADAWTELGTLEKEKINTGQVTAADLFGTRQALNGNYVYPDGRGGPRHLRQHRSRSSVSPLRQRLHRRTTHRVQQVHLPLPARTTSPGQCVLVTDHVRDARQLAGRQPDQPLPDQLTDAGHTGQGPRRGHHALHPEPVTRTRQGIQLATRAARTIPNVRSAVLAERRSPQRAVEATTTAKDLIG
ncbi:MAG: hypothetical protein JWR32_2629 [Mycobacterium sp.]|jgi:hypothetical protein|nr:hypothetical protein [Mycobacterium sp.]